MKKRVLFIGNSHTYLHYMPQMLEQLVLAGDCHFELEADQSVGEAVSLEWHWNSASTRRKMRSRNWDFIVLQERSGGPLENLESFREHARLLHSEIDEIGAATILYMTWANQNRPGDAGLLADAYRKMATELKAGLAPVGMAWTGVHQSSPELVLHHQDGRHASPIGAYLTACVFYAVLTHKSPLGLPATFDIEGKKRPDQDQAQARLLQNAVWETHRIADFGFRISD